MREKGVRGKRCDRFRGGSPAPVFLQYSVLASWYRLPCVDREFLRKFSVEGGTDFTISLDSTMRFSSLTTMGLIHTVQDEMRLSKERGDSGGKTNFLCG